MACHSGLVPCPKPSYAKLKRTYRKPGNDVYYAQATEEPEATRKSRIPKQDRMIKNISVEEWDCPRPGEKKYLPKEVKQNIRKNFRKMNADQKHAADSVAVK
jgi:hypothetical protein